MFKLIRMNDSATGTPDLINCRLQTGTHYTAGNAYVLYCCGLTKGVYRGPLYIACETTEDLGDDEYTSIKAYKVLPNMEFEAKCDPNCFDNVIVGTPLGISNASEDTVLSTANDDKIYFIVTEIINPSEYLVRVKAI